VPENDEVANRGFSGSGLAIDIRVDGIAEHHSSVKACGEIGIWRGRAKQVDVESDARPRCEIRNIKLVPKPDESIVVSAEFLTASRAVKRPHPDGPKAFPISRPTAVPRGERLKSVFTLVRRGDIPRCGPAA
jgi:hypothetical protein